MGPTALQLDPIWDPIKSDEIHSPLLPLGSTIRP